MPLHVPDDPVKKKTALTSKKKVFFGFAITVSPNDLNFFSEIHLKVLYQQKNFQIISSSRYFLKINSAKRA